MVERVSGVVLYLDGPLPVCTNCHRAGCNYGSRLSHVADRGVEKQRHKKTDRDADQRVNSLTHK